MIYFIQIITVSLFSLQDIKSIVFSMYFTSLFVCLGFYLFIYLCFKVTFNKLYRSHHGRVVLWAEETSTYSLVKVMYCKLSNNGKQLPVWGFILLSTLYRSRRDG